MKFIIIPIGVLLILAGAFFIYNSEILYGLIEDNLENSSLYLGAIIGRLIFGILLIKSASESKFPKAIKFLGFFVIIAAIYFILIGQVGFQKLLISLIPFFKPYGSLAGLVSMGFGGFLVYAFWEERNYKK